MRMTSSSTRRGTRYLAKTLNQALRMVLAFLFVFTAFAAHAVNESDLLSPAEAFPLMLTHSASVADRDRPGRTDHAGRRGRHQDRGWSANDPE